ncbi:MAG: TlpA family protein disulfide reductase [Pirellulales bacterium]|nr:TlpA family protein disulfide reductase [Pirellulales bacterium]
MLFPRRRSWLVCLLTGAVVAWLALGTAVAAEGEPSATPAEPVAVPPDPYKVPDAPPDELVRYINRLLGTRPPDDDARTKAVAAMKEAADKILAAESTEEQAVHAVQTRIRLADSAEELEQFSEHLQKAGKTQFVRQVGGAVLGRRLRELSRVPKDDAEGQLKPLIESVEKYLAEGPLERSDMGLAFNAGRVAEILGTPALAAETYTSFGKLFAASDDETIAGFGKKLEGVVRRLTLVGKEMKVEGTLLGGEVLDWAKYKGKVVLVDFWATWCGPCVREVPNMLETYAQYKDRGFEIVGISLDRDRTQLEKFIQDRAIPWTIVYDDGSPTAEYYGVMAIPTMILVGTDGKVVSTKARGEELRKELEKLLGPVEEKPLEEKKAEEEQKPG